MGKPTFKKATMGQPTFKKATAGQLPPLHMTQHTLLLLVAAPLLTLGHPLLAWMWALDPERREAVVHAFRGPRTLGAWRRVTTPLSVFLIQALALWLWHIPSWYEAALHSELIHAVEHLCFVLAGSLFWWAMVNGRYGRAGYGLGVLYVFVTAIHSSALGALLTVAPSVWYGEYARQGAAWQIDALADQQLAGLLMWIPAGVIFIVFGLALLAAWLGESERRVRLGATDAASRLLPIVVLACGILASAEQPVVQVRRHSTGDASPPAALLLPQILPVFSVVAPRRRGASPVSVRRQTCTTAARPRVGQRIPI